MRGSSVTPLTGAPTKDRATGKQNHERMSCYFAPKAIGRLRHRGRRLTDADPRSRSSVEVKDVRGPDTNNDSIH